MSMVSPSQSYCPTGWLSSPRDDPPTLDGRPYRHCGDSNDDQNKNGSAGHRQVDSAGDAPALQRPQHPVGQEDGDYCDHNYEKQEQKPIAAG